VSAVTQDDFFTLPRRVFLDSSTLQTLQDYGGFVWEGESIPEDDRIFGVEGHPEELEALRGIFIVNERAMFEFALSENSLAEVEAKKDAAYLRWAFDVVDHWQSCLAGYEGSPFGATAAGIAAKLDSRRFGYLSVKDRALLRDALALDCDAFLTMERRLPKNERHLRRELGIRIVRPTEWWRLIAPWARLYV
jgi:hypothetical protein